jgi:hypothetical protein
MEDLAAALSRHLALPFPPAIEKGCSYGRVDPVMIDADIYGWAQAASARSLDHEEVTRLRQARADLAASLVALPDTAVGYYESLLGLADLALATVPDA